MTYDDRIRATAIIALLAALLAALLGALWALQHGLAPESIAWAAGLAYGAVGVLMASALRAPLGAAVVTSIKYAGFTVAFSVWIAVAGTYAALQLLLGRAPKGVFA
ncbi:MAG: hypothetical protein JO362_13095 [Streptomycetaceae bacterium]|nr:hypothetical protein [Streptomycetaceae bacterium]